MKKFVGNTKYFIVLSDDFSTNNAFRLRDPVINRLKYDLLTDIENTRGVNFIWHVEQVEAKVKRRFGLPKKEYADFIFQSAVVGRERKLIV